MSQSTEAQHKAIVLEAFDTLFNKRDYDAAAREGLLVEHWDVVEDEASQAESKSGRPMFGDRFPL